VFKTPIRPPIRSARSDKVNHSQPAAALTSSAASAAPIFHIDESILSKALVAKLTATGIAFDRVIAFALKMMAMAESQPRPFLYPFALSMGLVKVTLRVGPKSSRRRPLLAIGRALMFSFHPLHWSCPTCRPPHGHSPSLCESS
jgi:hypothetical protein